MLTKKLIKILKFKSRSLGKWNLRLKFVCGELYELYNCTIHMDRELVLAEFFCFIYIKASI